MKTTLVLEDVQKQDELEFLFGKRNSAEDSESLGTWEQENPDYWEFWFTHISDIL